MSQQQTSCATCIYNVFNICKSYDGYYFYGEAIGEEEVPCQGWELDTYSYPIQLEIKK